MKVSARISNSMQENHIVLTTNGNEKNIIIPNKTEGRGSSINGSELLYLALATCFCNDIYREAARRNIKVDSVEVTVFGEFAKEGEPGSDIIYEAKVRSDHSRGEIDELIKYVDSIAEIHNTVRTGVKVTLKE